MARATAIDKLSLEHKRLLDEKLTTEGFCNYEALSAWLGELGYEIGKSSLHRYGQKMERKLEAVKASTQAAMMIAEAAPDDGDLRSSAVLSLVQTEFFNALMALQESEEDQSDPAKRLLLLSKVSSGIANISKASVHQKKWQLETQVKIQAEFDKLVAEADKDGSDVKTLELARQKVLEVYGVAE